jgi:hypothetical protein
LAGTWGWIWFFTWQVGGGGEDHRVADVVSGPAPQVPAERGDDAVVVDRDLDRLEAPANLCPADEDPRDVPTPLRCAVRAPGIVIGPHPRADGAVRKEASPRAPGIV